MAKQDAFKDWYDLTSEEYREYVNGDGQVYRIDKPQKLLLNKVSRTHYVLDSNGVVHTLMANSFMVCRFLDKNGVSFTSTDKGDTTRG